MHFDVITEDAKGLIIAKLGQCLRLVFQAGVGRNVAAEVMTIIHAIREDQL